jgi:hypothetical protein
MCTWSEADLLNSAGRIIAIGSVCKGDVQSLNAASPYVVAHFRMRVPDQARWTAPEEYPRQDVLGEFCEHYRKGARQIQSDRVDTPIETETQFFLARRDGRDERLVTVTLATRFLPQSRDEVQVQCLSACMADAPESEGEK